MQSLQHLSRLVFQRKKLEEDLSAELRSYLDLLTDQKVAAGISPQRARRLALLEIEGLEQVKEQVRTIWGATLLEGIVQDSRQSFRSMKSTPGTTALAILMLTLGIGATTLIFSIFYAVLLQPSPFAKPERLVQIWETRLAKGWQHSSVTAANFWDLRERNRTFEDIAAITPADCNLTGLGPPEHLKAGRVSAGFFRLLGLAPAAGRDFLATADQPQGANSVVLLQEGYWRKRFHADRGVLGQTLRLDGRAYIVAGVMPGAEPWTDDVELFIPMVRRPNMNRGSFELDVVGRLKANVSMEQATADLARIGRELAQEYPRDDVGMGALLGRASDWGAGPGLRRVLTVLFGAVGVLLLIACVNLTNLTLAKGTVRSREITVRSALGASRWRILRLLLTESLLQSLAGGACGVLLAYSGVLWIRSSHLVGIPRIADVSLNGRVLLFTALVIFMAGTLAGLLPALQLATQDLTRGLREGDRTQKGSRKQITLRATLVSVEVALALTLLIGAGLFLRSFSQILRVERGFAVEHRLLFTVNLPTTYSEKRVETATRRLLDQLGTLAGVSAVGAVNTPPLSSWDPGMGIVSATGENTSGPVPWASWRFVSSDYFAALGMSLRSGRVFSREDEIGHPWRVVVSRGLAQRFWPGREAVGQRVILWKGQGNHAAEVIGVVGDVHEHGLEADAAPLVFLPLAGTASNQFTVAVNSPLGAALIPAVRRQLAQIDPELPLSKIMTLEDLVNDSVQSRKLNLVLMLAFALTALLLTLSGLYGVLAYSVAQRRSEISLRMVLGATRSSILLLILRQGLRPTLLGMAAGVALSLSLSRFLQSILYGIQASDAATYVAVTLLIATTAGIACLTPAIRACLIAPAAGLRRE